jgi:hypothetical protein
MEKEKTINDISLTPELLNFIYQMQNDEQFGLDSCQQSIAETVCFLGGILSSFDREKDKKNAIDQIEALCYLREQLEVFRIRQHLPDINQ